MKKRQVLIIAIALVIIVGGKLGMNFLAKPAEKADKKSNVIVATVFTTQVQNDTIPVFVNSTGVLEAVNRLELFSEVQGVMEADNGKFKAGNSFQKGDLLISIRSKDQEAQLFAQRSTFESTVTSIMPDLKADYPAEFPKWKAYLNNFSTKRTTIELPEVKSDKLKSFLVGRGIYSSYHSLKNIEIVNSKYNIRAPYDGVLISANIDPGTVIRPGQALGIFIQPSVYELETSTDALTAERLDIGQKVMLQRQGNSHKIWEGKISRLVRAIDKNSQMSTFFVEVKSTDLKEGLFLQARVKANEIANAFEISRASLVDGNKVFVVEKDSLVLKQIKNEYFNQNKVIISGLKNGDQVLTQVPPSAFEGMKVSVYKGI